MATALIDDAIEYLRTPKLDWSESRTRAWQKVLLCLTKLKEDHTLQRRTVTTAEMIELIQNLDLVLLGLCRTHDYDVDFQWVDKDASYDGRVKSFLETGSGTMEVANNPEKDDYAILATVLHELVHIYIDVQLYHLIGQPLPDDLELSNEELVELSEQEHGQLWQKLARDVEIRVSAITGQVFDLGRPEAIVREYSRTRVRPKEWDLHLLFDGTGGTKDYKDVKTALDKFQDGSTRFKG